MKTTRLSGSRVNIVVVVLCVTIGCMFWDVDNSHSADAPPANLSPGLQEVVKLAQAHMGDDVILAYIKNSAASYTLSADDILYLKSQGVSQNVITALLQTKSVDNQDLTPTNPVPSNPLPSSASTWMQTSAPNGHWENIVSSADGTRLAAVVLDGPIFISSDSAATWTQTSAPHLHWSGLASSADGTKLVATTTLGSPGGLIYTSPDSGATWMQASVPSAEWDCVASSGDGTKLAATERFGPIYVSSDSGATWTATTSPGANWGPITSSADGTKLAAAVLGGSIYTSSDSGTTWRQTSAPTRPWQAIASSADGTKLVATAGEAHDFSPIYISSDSGATWRAAGAPNNFWFAVASSADGTKLAAAVFNGPIFISSDSGATWNATSVTSSIWEGLSFSVDGTRLFAAGGGPTEVGGIYTWQSTQGAPTTPPPAPPAAPQENLGLVQEYNGYSFELKECRVEDRQDRPVNDGRPHQQLVCKVLVTNKTGDRKLSMCAVNYGEHTRVINDMGTEYDCCGGDLGTSSIRRNGWNGLENAELVVPSGVPVGAMLWFGENKGIGYFSPEAKSLGVLDIIFISNDTGGKSFHIQFKNVPIPLVEAPTLPVATILIPPPASVQTPPPPPPSPVASVPVVAPAPQINFTYFHDQLAPFGTWVELPGYGPCWYPEKVIAANPDWRPYYDSGRWVQTENGLFWQSDYNWGDIPFHYGRWIRDPRYGWLWVPDYTWGPAWVCWRQAEADGYIGWAPLPYGAVWVDGGWRFHDRAIVDVGFDFGLGEDFFVFVGYDHFHEGFPHRLRGHYGEYAFHVPRERVHEFYGRAVIRNDFRSDEHGRFVNGGIGRERLERIAQVTHHQMEQAHFQERHPVGDRERLAAERTEQVRNQDGQGHEQSRKPDGQPPASVSKVYRPPVEKPIPAGTSTPPPKNTGTHSGK